MEEGHRSVSDPKRSSELTPQQVGEMAWGFAPSLVLEAALRNHIFDALERGPRSLREISQETVAAERGLRPILSILVAIGILEKDTEECYGLTQVAKEILVRGRAGYQGAVLQHVSRRVLPWLELAASVQSGRPVSYINREEQGVAFYRETVSDLFALSYPSSQILAWELKIAKVEAPMRVLDIGAGSGVWGIGLAKASPLVTVTAVDWEGVLPMTRRTAELHAVIDRFTFVAGNIHEVAFEAKYDLAILGHVLHSEGRNRNRLLLKRVFDALKPGGSVAIADFLVNKDRTGPLISLFVSVAMLLNTDEGDTFTFEEIRSWLDEAGFVRPTLLKVPGPAPLILAGRP
jgi:2-polyprenyl-3-methyl-5-hydroxy-6-metoxy-1,4-benzoquinol methylase